MTNNDFQRSNLTIQPKQRLMSAGSFINPVRTYDANEQIRIVESFRGLSAESDKLIDGFIKKKQDEAQQEADKYMTDAMLDPNHPEHKKAKEMMNSLKPQAVNLLGVDYWTQQYISKAQAEQLFKKEEYKMADAKQKYANLSPDEFREKLGEIRVKTDDELTTYPKSVRDYFYRMPRQELTDKIRDRHYEAIMQEQLKTRDNIFKNNLINAFDSIETGLISIESDMLSEDEFVMKYKEFTPEKQKEIEAKAVKLGDIFGEETVVVGANNKIIRTSEFNRYASAVSAIEDSSLFQNAKHYIMQAAEAGMRADEIQENLFNSLKGAIDKGEDEEMAAIAYITLMTNLNSDSELSDTLGSWRYGNNKQLDANGKNIVNFDMPLAETKAKEIISYGTSVRSEEIRRANVEDYFEKQEQERFLELAARSELITEKDWLMLDGIQIAKKLNVDYYKYKDTINGYKQAVSAGFNVEYTDRHIKQYGDTLYAIQTGKIKSKREIAEMAGYNFHMRDYPKLLEAFDNEGGAKADRRIKTTDQLLHYVYKDIESVDDNVIPPREKDALKAQLFKDVFAMNLEFTPENVDKVIKYYQQIATLTKQTDNGTMFDRPFKPSNKELQTTEQFKQSIISRQGEMGVDKDGNKTPVQRVEKADTINDFLQTDLGEALKNTSLSEEQQQEVFAALRANTKQADREAREKELIDIAKKDTVTKDELIAILHENPDALTKAFNGVELIYTEGVFAPKDKELRSRFMSLITNKVINKSKSAKREIELLKSFTNINGSD